MRTVPAALQSHLNTRATTLCWCWKITRQDATVMGFTNHDKDLSFGSIIYQAATGLSGSELEETLGLGVDNMEVEGAVSSTDITEEEIAAGDYDHALVEIYLVNWATVAQRLLLKRARIGEVTRGETGFQAELRGLAADVQQPTGRLYQYKCDAILGDARCAVDLDNSTYKASVTVSASPGRTIIKTTGLGSYDEGWFTHGLLTFTSGDNDGRSFEIKSHADDGTTQTIVLWGRTPFDIEAGDGFDIVAGCDKTFKTCKAKFSNPVNFRGFPHMPEEEIIIRYPNKGDPGLDGGGNYNGAD